MANNLPDAPFSVPDAPFDAAKVRDEAPFAQSQARDHQHNQSVTQAHQTIAKDPSAISVSAGQIPLRVPGVTPAQAQQQGQTALGRVGTVMSTATMGFNYGMRQAAGDQGTNAQIRQIIGEGGLFGDPGKKLDSLGQLLTANSVGELDFWSHQPGVYDAIMHAHPTTPEGAALQLALGMRADFARWKQGYPIFTAAETFGMGLLDPTAWAMGLVGGKLLGAVGTASRTFTEAAGAAARTAEVPKLPGAVTAKARPVSRAGAAVGRTFPEQTKVLGSAYRKLASTMQDTLPIIGDRFAAARREYGTLGEWTHNKMVNDHSHVPVTTSVQMLSNDLFGGLSRDQKIQMAYAIEAMPKILGGQEASRPEWQIPIRGVSIMQRAQNWSDMQMAKLQRYQKLMPKTFKLMMPPKTWGTLEMPEGDVGAFQPRLESPQTRLEGEGQGVFAVPPGRVAPAEEITPLQVSDWFPRRGAWERKNARPGVGATGQQGAYGLNIKRRTLGTLEEAQRPEVLRDFTGRPVGRLPGMQLAEDWDPAKGATRKDIQTENYATMLQHVHDGRSLTMSNGKSAVLDVEYHWPGGEVWHGAKVGDFDLSKGQAIGSGPMGAETASALADKIAPYWANKFHVTPSDARNAVLDRMTSAFQKEHPTHLVNAGRILRTPDIDGLAVEGTYLRMVGDANPVLRWLGTGESVATRIPGEAGEFTHFQSAKAFPSGTVSGVTPSDVQSLHFNGIEDDALPHAGLLRNYDAFTSIVRMGKLFNFIYHPVFNVHPALTNLLLEHAGMSPVKIMKYSVQLDGALMGSILPAAREAMTTATEMFRGGNIMGREFQPGARWDVPTKWMKEAEEWGATSKGAFGTGVPIDEYVHLFSSPRSELDLGEQAHRAIAAGSQWNQNLTFNVMEARMVATVFHILKDDEHMPPHEAARAVNKAINDYSNLTNVERNPNVNRVYWFYAFKKMQMRRAAASLATRANVLGTESRTIQQWNQSQGDPNRGDRAIVLGRNPDGSTYIMSTSMAPFRFGSDIAAMPGLGGGRESGRAWWSLGAGTLAPVPDAVARGMATAYRASKGASATPQPWDWTTGFSDVKQPIDVQIRQALGQAGEEFLPFPYAPTPTQYTGLEPRQYGQLSAAASNLRNLVRYMNPDLQRRAMDLVQRLDNGDTTAIGEARGLYSAVELSRRKSGW